MSHQDDSAYYGLRAAEEVLRGDEATNEAIAAIHYELAFRYEVLAAQLRTEGPKLTLVNRGSNSPSPSHGPAADRVRISSGGPRSFQVASFPDQGTDRSLISPNFVVP
jgi:hypothetical protein